MKGNIKIFIIVSFILIVFQGCEERKKIKHFDLLASKKTIGVYGGNYRGVFSFRVDKEGSVYIGNGKKVCIDKYERNGKYLYSFGRRGNGPGEFQWVPFICFDNNLNLYAINNNKLQIFNKNGIFKKSVKIPDNPEWGYLQNIEYVYENKVILTYENSFRYRFVLYDFNTVEERILLRDEKKYSEKAMKFHNLLARFTPAIFVDKDGNIYIADSVDYKIYIFDKNGKYKRTFEKKYRHIKIDLAKDFILPNIKSKRLLKELKSGITLIKMAIKKIGGIYENYPDIIGLNIDNNKIYIWSSKRDINGYGYIVDIYNKNFRLLEKRNYYDDLRHRIVIRNNFLYIPDILPEKNEKVGRVSWALYSLGTSEKILKFKLKS